MNPFEEIPENLSSFLNGTITQGNIPAVTFFNGNNGQFPALPIYTEKKATTSEKLQESLMKRGISIFLGTVDLNDAKMQVTDAQGNRTMTFGGIDVLAYIVENPKVNTTGVDYGDVAYAVAWFGSLYRPTSDGGQLVLKSIRLSPPPQFSDPEFKQVMRARLVRFALADARFNQVPARA